MRNASTAYLMLFCAVSLFFSPFALGETKATIYRDTYGVPHIYADTAPAAAYALGYAQAEDRLDDIYKNIRTALGSMAEFFGPDHVETDYIMRLFRNAQVCEEKWGEVPDPVRAICGGFMDGVKAYVAEHPARVPEYALDLEAWHSAAVGRAMILGWPLGVLRDDLRGKASNPNIGSNGWAVSPSRSALGCPILLTDPHLTWESLAVFYEARIHGGEFNLAGFCLVGTPMVALGHGEHVGWACTTGGPDTSDVYMLKLNPDMPTQYEYEGKWLYPEIKFYRIPVKGEDKPRVMPAVYTIHGPLLEEPDTENLVAYAGKTPYMDDIGLMEQFYAMATAKNTQEFFQALGMNHLMEQNLIFADRDGNIGYARVGLTPIRPEGYDWSKPVPGHTKATEWLGLHPIEDLVHIFNPPQGYLQNCNISPANMMIDSPLTPDKYPTYIYNVSWDQNNPRGKRAVQLLSENDAITREEAIDITMDIYDLLAEPWKIALRNAVENAGGDRMADEAFAGTVKDILEWNGEFEQNSTAATVIERWRLKCQNEIDVKAVAEGDALSESDQETMLDLLQSTLSEMEQVYGKIRVAWGEAHVVGRGERYYPYDGADFGRGANQTTTLRCVKARENPPDSGRYVARSGTMSAMLMFFHKDGIESHSSIPWGQSVYEDSPHFMDQGRELYSKRKMKPVWFKKDDLMNHVTSERTLTIP